MKYSKKEIIATAKNLALVVIGTLIVAFGTAVFILPHNLVVGGVSGMAIIINKFMPLEFLTRELIITVLTWLFFFMGLIFLGKSFTMKTLVSTIVYPIGIAVFGYLARPDVFNGFFYLESSGYSELSLILAAVFGGALIGTGCAITFLGGGSTGGVDILVFTFCKYIKGLKSSVAIGIIDITIVVLGMFATGSLVISLLGVLSVFISATTVDKVFLGNSQAFVAQIITEKYKEINEQVISQLERTTTLVNITGGYSGREMKMVMVTFSIREYAELINVINKCDGKAFITVHRAHEINGEGWTRN